MECALLRTTDTGIKVCSLNNEYCQDSCTIKCTKEEVNKRVADIEAERRYRENKIVTKKEILALRPCISQCFILRHMPEAIQLTKGMLWKAIQLNLDIYWFLENIAEPRPFLNYNRRVEREQTNNPIEEIPLIGITFEELLGYYLSIVIGGLGVHRAIDIRFREVNNGSNIKEEPGTSPIQTITGSSGVEEGFGRAAIEGYSGRSTEGEEMGRPTINGLPG